MSFRLQSTLYKQHDTSQTFWFSVEKAPTLPRMIPHNLPVLAHMVHPSCSLIEHLWRSIARFAGFILGDRLVNRSELHRAARHASRGGRSDSMRSPGENYPCKFSWHDAVPHKIVEEATF
jgi:hypothetical protein